MGDGKYPKVAVEAEAIQRKGVENHLEAEIGTYIEIIDIIVKRKSEKIDIICWEFEADSDYDGTMQTIQRLCTMRQRLFIHRN